ncbi:lysophospholipid acyltransferase family protein [Acinetobacter oleivorans]|uniref:lysophospholipid acyltransferase family protein n=1 Tax=Acinetobacter oleivorans TaxID=1148157 RepID=UPI0011A39CA8|nr:lysophospholipid acyltransferase family protein [Acinetobacter oleivorans]
MTKLDTKSMNYYLLKTFSRQPIQFGRFLARMLAGLINTLKITKTSKSIELNLQIALPHLTSQQRIEIMQQAIRNEVTSYFEFLSIWGSSNSKNIERIHHIEGEHYFHEALAAKKGVVLIVPHFGTWEVLNAWCSQFTSMTILYKPVKNEDADRFVREARSREQAHLVPTDETGVRQIFKALKQGETTVILPDHTPNVGGSMINYFGVPLASSNLSTKLIQKTKAKALFLYAIRNENDGFTMHVEPMDEKIYEGSADDGTYVIHQAIEQLIHRYPEHYHWSYKRFKANPALDNIYNIDPAEALQIVDKLKAEASQISVKPSTLETSSV